MIKTLGKSATADIYNTFAGAKDFAGFSFISGNCFLQLIRSSTGNIQIVISFIFNSFIFNIASADLDLGF